MNILLTNDDGIYAEGIYALYLELRKIARVTIVAPDTERSASGHAITLTDPLRVEKAVKKGKFLGYKVNGTPADCVKIGIGAVLKKKPDMIFSGINQGPNIGTNVIYSGTVSAATEGAILGIPSIAVSLTTFTDPDFSLAAAFSRRLCLLALKRGIPEGTLLNVNVPAAGKNRIKGVRVTHQGKFRFAEFFKKRSDPRGRGYYWMGGEEVTPFREPEADHAAVNGRFISITPIHYDMTSYCDIPVIKGWDFKSCLRS
ncbi:MAG: 5'/3'-nucleotidase SurE [bacterium]